MKVFVEAVFGSLVLLAMLVQIQGRVVEEEEARRYFDLMDKDKSGFVTRDEILDFLLSARSGTVYNCDTANARVEEVFMYAEDGPKASSISWPAFKKYKASGDFIEYPNATDVTPGQLHPADCSKPI